MHLKDLFGHADQAAEMAERKPRKLVFYLLLLAAASGWAFWASERRGRERDNAAKDAKIEALTGQLVQSLNAFTARIEANNEKNIERIERISGIDRQVREAKERMEAIERKLEKK